MNETKQDSGAHAQEQDLEKFLEMNKEIKLFFNAELIPSLGLANGKYKYHFHLESKVPKRSLRLWKKRGFKPLEIGVAHVRFEGSEKKYTFPAFFWNTPKKAKSVTLPDGTIEIYDADGKRTAVIV